MSEPDKTKLLWHYTTWNDFRLIRLDGVIKPTAVHILAGEHPAVWFSANPTWEPTASKGIRFSASEPFHRASMEEMMKFAGGLVRIGVSKETVPVAWKDFRAAAHLTKERFEGLERSGRDSGSNPDEWFATFAPVPRNRWLAVEVFKDGRWLPLREARG